MSRGLNEIYHRPRLQSSNIPSRGTIIHVTGARRQENMPSSSSKSKSKSSSRSGVKVDIVVQPPVIAGINQVLVPPIVARTSDPSLIRHIHNVFGTLFLYSSSDGSLCEYSLHGTSSVSPQLVKQSSENSSQNVDWLYFIFNHVYVSTPGPFAFDVMVTARTTAEPHGKNVGHKHTRNFEIVGWPEMAGSPSKSMLPHHYYVHPDDASANQDTTYQGPQEEQVLSLLRQGGHLS